MTEAENPTPPLAPARTASRRLKIAFAVSLAMNLAVAGLVAGVWLHDGGPGRGGGPRDLAFGPFSEAFSPADRKALRAALRDNMAEIRANRVAARAEFKSLLAALRADPYVPAAADAALGAIVTRNAARLAQGQKLLAERIAAMAPQDRLAFADRLEKALRRGLRD